VLIKFKGGRGRWRGGPLIKQASSEQEDDGKVLKLNIEKSGIT